MLVVRSVSKRLPLQRGLSRLHTVGSLSDCEDFLGVGHGASIGEVKEAFRVAAKLHHPDVLGGSEENFVRLRVSYERLLRTAPGRESSAQDQAPPDTSQSTKVASRRQRPRTWAEARAAGLRTSIADPSAIVVSSTAETAMASRFCREFFRVDDFNRMPAYATSGSPLYLFFSFQFSDWKIGERLADTGLCLAFTNGRGVPWQGGG